jgi:hypothetical protein
MISIILVFLAGILNASMDVVSSRWDKSIFKKKFIKYEKFFNPKISWLNKYKNGVPALGEKFPLSSTSLVFLTDWWHLAKFLMIICLTTAIVFYTPIFGIIDLIIFYLTFSVTFEIFYSKILSN